MGVRPLIVAGRTIGAWMAAFKNPVAFTPDERSVLTTVARMLAQALARAGEAENEREFSLGLQRSMMPTLGPEIPGMTVAARYVPTGGGLQVGGDWYDMIPLPGGGSGALVIGDVQGHDVRAAGPHGTAQDRAAGVRERGPQPRRGPLARLPLPVRDHRVVRAARAVGRRIRRPRGTRGHADHTDYAPRFATCLYIEVDPATGTLDIARAGHPDPVIRTADGTALIRPTAGGLPLGIEADSDYPTTRLVLDPDETIMICTDGLIETGGHDMASGWTRLRPVLEKHTGDSLEQLADELVQAVHGPSSHHTTGPLVDRARTTSRSSCCAATTCPPGQGPRRPRWSGAPP